MGVVVPYDDSAVRKHAKGGFGVRPDIAVAMAAVDEDKVDRTSERREIEGRGVPQELRDPLTLRCAQECDAAVPAGEIFGVGELERGAIGGIGGGEVQRVDLDRRIVV